MINETSHLLVPHGHPAAPKVLLRSQTYTMLMRAIRISMPSAAAGALTGSVQQSGGHEWITIEATEAVGLVETGSGLAPDPGDWAEIEAEIKSARTQETDIVGWFFARPGLDFSNPGIDLDRARESLPPRARLLLLVDPSAGQGAFYTWQDGRRVPTGGYYEALPREH